MTLGKRIQLISAALTLLALSAFTSASAQEPARRRYEVTAAADGSKVATVETSVGEQLVSVSIIRRGRPTHLYTAFLPSKVTHASVGGRPLFTVYHDEEIVKAGSFNHRLSEVSGPARRKHPEIERVRQRLAGDMPILRAVRGFDARSAVLLAELGYVIVTYDDTVIEGEPPRRLKVAAAAGPKPRLKRRASEE